MKKKKSLKPRNPISSETVLQKTWLGKLKLREFVTKRFSLKESTSGWKKRIPNAHSYLYKGLKSTKNGKYLAKCMTFPPCF